MYKSINYLYLFFRVKITGNYNKHECGIQIENLNEADAGRK